MNLRKEFLQYVIPSMLAFALSGVYAIADGFFVGNALGDHALAAVNIAYPMTALLQAVGTGIGMGGAIRYAITKGNQDQKHSDKYFTVSLLLLLLVSCLLTLLYLFMNDYVLRLFGAEAEILSLAKEYMHYITLGALFQILGTGIVPFIRNMGGSLPAMVSMIAGFLTNIMLDYLFVWVLDWGMMGAALATIIAQAMTFLVCLFVLIQKKQKPLLPTRLELPQYCKHIISVGISPFGLTFSPNITLILVNKYAMLFGGTLALTAYAPISYLCCIILLLMQGISDGTQPLISTAYGEGKHEHIKEFRKYAYLASFLTAIFCMLVLYLSRHHTASLFGASQIVSEQVAQILPIFLTGFLFLGISRVTIAYFYAISHNLSAYILIFGEPLCLFVLLFILSPFIGIWGTWISVPASQILIAVLSLLLLRFNNQQQKRIQQKKLLFHDCHV